MLLDVLHSAGVKMQLLCPLRGPSLCVGNHVLTTKLQCHSAPNFGCRRSCFSRQAVSSSEGESTTSAHTSLTSSNPSDSDQHGNVIDVDVQAIFHSWQTGEPKPTAATSGGEADWLEAPPGDWGGTVDNQVIKEPDSSGVLLFSIIIAGLSVGVHHLIRALGPFPGEEQLLSRRPTGQVAVVVAPASSPNTHEHTSKSWTSAEGNGLMASTSITTSGSVAGSRSALDMVNSNGAATASSVEGKGGMVPATHKGPEEDETRGSERPLRSSPALPGVSNVETVDDVDVDASESGAGDSEQLLRQQEQPQSASRSSADLLEPLTSTLATPGEGRASALDELQESSGRPPAESSETVMELQMRSGPPGSRSSQETLTIVEAVKQDVAIEAAAQPHVSSISATNNKRADDNLQSLWGRPIVQGEQANSGLGPSTSAVRPVFPFAGASGIPNGSGAGGIRDVLTATASALQVAEPLASTRLSLPAVRPEPLSRALDSSALAQLSSDSSVGSLRERAQLALRAASGAVEASQRAASYAAAASSAASRAAEAAERAASAASLAQAGLETAAESAIVAAEARVAQASEAAKDAEERAASAAAHATAYQDMSQSLAHIAERAAAVHKPSAPGPLTQLQQLWRSASSALTPGHQQGVQNSSVDWSSDVGMVGRGSTSDITLRDDKGSFPVVSGGDASGNAGATAAQTITSTVKGILSWLGQGEGTR